MPPANVNNFWSAVGDPWGRILSGTGRLDEDGFACCCCCFFRATLRRLERTIKEIIMTKRVKVAALPIATPTFAPMERPLCGART